MILHLQSDGTEQFISFSFAH